MSDFPDNERFRKLLLSYPSKAIQFLYEYFYEDLLRIATRLTRDVPAAEDIVQETFLHVWLNHAELARPNEKPIVRYLIRVVQNMSINIYRRRSRDGCRKDEYDRLTRSSGVDNSEEDKIVAQEMMAHIQRLIQEFPRREKECYRWREDNWTNKQIADRLRISEKAVERTITSVNKRLRKLWYEISRP